MMTENPTPSFRRPRQCGLNCMRGIDTVKAILRTDTELAAKVGDGTVTITAGSHDPQEPQSCVLTAKAGRLSIFENMEVNCENGVLLIPTSAEIR